MSGSVRLQPGQSVKLVESQMHELKLSSFEAEKDGWSMSNLSEYAGYNFTWFAQCDRIPGTLKKTNFTYHLTMHHHYPLPPLDTPTELADDDLVSLYIRADGRSPRADLKGYVFQTAFLGVTEKGSRYSVTMRKV